MVSRARRKKVGAACPDLAEEASARSRVYGFLSTVFRQEPTDVLIREVKGHQWAVVLSDLGVRLGEAFFQKPLEGLMEELAVEYAGLFLGPGEHISPHASVHMDEACGGGGLLWGEETVRVKRFIEATGLTYAEDYKGIPDHVSVELEFLEKMTAQERDFWNEGNAEDAEGLLRIERRFLEDHVLRWVPRFCDKIAENAELPFYKAMAELTKEFLELHCERLSEHSETLS